MMEIRQSTSITVLIGPFLDETDGKTAETGLAILQADVRLSKNAGNMAQKNEATACTHDELGYYTCPLNTTDTGTLGRLKLMVHESGALPVWHDFMVVSQQFWDSKYSTDELQVHVVEYTAGVITAAAIADGAIDAATFAAGAIDAAAIAANAIGASEIADGAIDAATFAAGAIDAAAIAADAITAAKLAADCITSDEIAATALTEIADAVLERGVANVEDAAEVDSLAALVLAKLHGAISGTTLTIYKTDDTTVFDTKTVVKDASADPITSVADP